MPSTYLQIVQTACDELGLARPSVVIASTDLQIRQLSALMNRDLRELQQNYDWTALQTEFDLHVGQPFTTIGNLTQNAYAILNVPVTGFSDESSDFNMDFGGLETLLANPSLFVVNGSDLPVDTRIVSAVQIGSVMTLAISQPCGATVTGAPIVIMQDTYPGPADFDRYINQTWWDRTNRWALMGPDSPQVDQWHRSGIVTIGPRRHFRQIGYEGLTQATGSVNNYRIWPPPGATDTPINLVYEYISVNCVLSATLVPQPKFQADTDFPVLDENMMILGAKWRMWQIKGFDYSSMQAEYVDYVDRKYANDGGAKTLSLPGVRANMLVTSGLVQDGNFPGPGNP
jgi:hypothetical protein